MLSGEADGVGVLKEVPCSHPAPWAADLSAPHAAGTREQRMADAINSAGWSKVGVQFRSAGELFPVAHNKLAALRRDGWRRAFEVLEQAHEGRPVMEHAARYLLGEEKAEEVEGELVGDGLVGV